MYNLAADLILIAHFIWVLFMLGGFPLALLVSSFCRTDLTRPTGRKGQRF